VEHPADGPVGFCGIAADDTSGCWFKLTVPGSNPGAPLGLVATTDGSLLPDTQLAVFGGSCSSLSCLDFYNDANGNQVYWEAVTGETYYLFVTGSILARQIFQLDIDPEGFGAGACEMYTYLELIDYSDTLVSPSQVQRSCTCSTGWSRQHTFLSG